MAALDARPLEVVVSNGLIEAYRTELESSAAKTAMSVPIRWHYVGLDDHSNRLESARYADVWLSHILRPDEARQADRLSLIALPGVGTNGLALDALSRQPTVVTAAYHGRAIAQFVLTAMSMLARRLTEADRALRQGRWRNPVWDPEVPITASLDGGTVGIIGYGDIGRQVARLSRAFGMRVLAIRSDPSRFDTHDPNLDWSGGIEELPTLLAESDFVVVCVPLTDATRSLLSETQFEYMRRTAIVVNVARGPVIEERAFYNALRSGRIAGAAIDVWYSYPDSGALGRPSSEPFWELDNVLLAPHLSGTSADVFRARARHLGRRIGEFAADSLGASAD